MPPQSYSWTCSACSLDWVMRAAGIVPDYTRPRAVEEIGYPEQINPTYGLTNIDGPGQALMDVLGSYGQASRQGWLSFDEVYAAAQEATGMMSGSAWYHWVALRGVQGDTIAVANSAPGYKGIGEPGYLTRADFERLGPFNVVLLT